MKYSTVKIDIDLNNEWVIRVSRNSEDRVETATVPNGLGFYHYPETESDQEAANKLIEHMVQRHQHEMGLLQKSMEGLIKLRESYNEFRQHEEK